MVSAGTHIKCAAGTLRAYLRRRTDDALASFVSSRSLSVRGSWGAAPSAFWYGAPGGTQGPLGKGGAAERWRVAYPIGIATRHGAKPATTHTSKRNATAASRTSRHPPATPRRRRRPQTIHCRVGIQILISKKPRPAARRLPTWSKISSAAHTSANRSPAPARRDPSPPQNIIINPSKLSPYKSTSYVNSTQHFPIL